MADESGGDRAAWRPDVQGLRAVAVLLVVLFHAGLAFPGGYIGVDVFFVISGFVIGSSLLRELDRTGRVRLGRFYARRIRRLLPALALVLVVTNLAASVVGPIGALHATQRTGIAAVLFNANTYLAATSSNYFAPIAELNPLLHIWSLSVEEQFYFVFPLLMAGTWVLASRLERDRRLVLGVVLSTIAGASLALSILWSTGRFGTFALLAGPQETAFFSMPSRAWEFIAGLLAALWLRGPVFERSSASLAAGSTGLIAIVASAAWLDQDSVFPGVNAIVPVLGTVLLIVAGSGSHGHLLDRLLGHRVAQYFGNLSYSWYLWHWPLVVFAAALWPTARWAAPLAAALSLVPAALSYRYVEQPIRLEPRWPTAVVAAFSVAVPAIVALGMGAAVQRGSTVTSYEHAIRPHYDAVHGCDSGVPIGERTAGECIYEPDDAVGRAVLLGDSNAGHFSDAFVAAARANGYSFEIATLARCATVDALILWSGAPQARCRDFIAASIQAIHEDPPDVVVLAGADMYIEQSIYEIVLPTGETLSERDEKTDAWERLLGSVLDRIDSPRTQIVILETVPKPGWDPRSCAVIRWRLGERGCSVEFPRPEMKALGRGTVAAERAVTAGPGRETIDFFDAICPGDPCGSHRSDGSLVWRDGGHISVDMTLALTPFFDDMFSAARSTG